MKLIKLLSEQRESGCAVYIFTLKVGLRHSEHKYTLYKPYDAEKAASHEAYDYSDNTGGSLSEIKILYTECTDKYSKQSGYTAALAGGSCSKYVVRLGTIVCFVHFVRFLIGY